MEETGSCTPIKSGFPESDSCVTSVPRWIAHDPHADAQTW